MRHFYRSVFVLGLMILPVLRSAGATNTSAGDFSRKGGGEVVPQGTAKMREQAPAKSAAAQAATAKPAPLEVPQLKFEKYKLDNGLEVIFFRGSSPPVGCRQPVVSRRAGEMNFRAVRVSHTLRTHDV